MFQWLFSVERAIKHIQLVAPNALTELYLLTLVLGGNQAPLRHFEATVQKITLAKDSHTASGRPIHNLLAKCYVSRYGKGDTRTMFDTINTFLKFAADAKINDKDSSKV